MEIKVQQYNKEQSDMLKFLQNTLNDDEYKNLVIDDYKEFKHMSDYEFKIIDILSDLDYINYRIDEYNKYKILH